MLSVINAYQERDNERRRRTLETISCSSLIVECHVIVSCLNDALYTTITHEPHDREHMLDMVETKGIPALFLHFDSRRIFSIS